jgi:myosin I
VWFVLARSAPGSVCACPFPPPSLQVHNNNSSRFGKWCSVHFDDVGHISTCKVQSYLLEKSRVVAPGAGERNYHIFYSMLAGATAEERSTFGLLASVADYAYTSEGPADADGINDAEEWATTVNKLDTLGFSLEQQTQVFKLLSGVLLMGNIKFVDGDKDTQKASDPAVLSRVAELFKVGPQQLESALTSRKVSSGRGSSYTVPLTLSQCVDLRDALAKAIYANLFDWVVNRLNVFMQMSAVRSADDDDDEDELFVGLLDVFGFEARRATLPFCCAQPQSSPLLSSGSTAPPIYRLQIAAHPLSHRPTRTVPHSHSNTSWLLIFCHPRTEFRVQLS